MNGELSFLAFKALHAVYHERDFRVRVNDPTISFVRRVLAKCVGEEKLKNPDLSRCPACAAGFALDYNDEQPGGEQCGAVGGLGPVFNATSVTVDGQCTYYGGTIACTKCRAHFQRDATAPTTGVERIPDHPITRDVP
jgi:hypothetical protein